MVEEKVGRPAGSAALRWLLGKTLPKRGLFGAMLGLGRAFKPLMPSALARQIPAARVVGEWPAARHARKMVVLQGCVQPSMAPSINSAAARVLDAVGISLVRAQGEGCCGAVSHHLQRQEDALGYIRANIDAWWPHVESGVEAIVITASGCGTMVRDYGHLLERDPAYAAKAARITAISRDISEVVAAEADALRRALAAAGPAAETRIAFHSPCSLQHGQKIRGVVEALLRDAGFVLTPVPDAHVCCGSAGTYSILQRGLSEQLLANKVQALESGSPQEIATANIGCLSHIGSGTALSVRHWIELVDARLAR
jgi:glycolate oxidase iron-sulfur subunit